MKRSSALPSCPIIQNNLATSSLCDLFTVSLRTCILLVEQLEARQVAQIYIPCCYQYLDHTLRQKRKALGELDIDWKTAECGQEKSLSLLEDEQGTHKQDHNRFNAMKKKAEAVDIGSEMKKPEGLIVPTRRQNFSTVASAPRRSLDGARRRGAGGIV